MNTIWKHKIQWEIEGKVSNLTQRKTEL